MDDHLFAVLNEIEKMRELGFGFVYAEFHGLGLCLVQFLGPWKSAIFTPRIGAGPEDIGGSSFCETNPISRP
jgi:hypothetical protein